MKNSHSYKLIFGRVVMVSAIALIGFATTAQAGFEWRGPLEAPTPPATQAAPAPAEGVMPPVTSWDGTAEVSPTWNDSAVNAAPMQTPTNPSPALAPFVAETPLPEPVDAGDVLAGFGTDLPLVIALQQVVPPGYQYSFSEGVNLGQPVSWEGGKAWQHVLGDMLAKEGLGYRLQQNIVVVGYFPPEEIAPPVNMPPVNMMEAPAVTSTAPQSAPIEWNGSAEDAPKTGEPVIIRRQRPGTVKATQEAPAEAEAITAAPAPAWETSSDRTANQSRAMSYPPAQTSTAPVAVTSEPPAAQNRISAAESSAPLSAPPPMDMGVMSQEPPSDDPVDITAADQAGAAMADEAAPVETVAPTPQVAEVAAGKGLWNGTQGATLRDTLKNWSDSAGVDLYWSIDYDYRLKKSVELDGSYDQAVAALLDQFSDVRPQPYGQLHQGKDGPRVLVVRSYDLTP
jgi:hypothetical protein